MKSTRQRLLRFWIGAAMVVLVCLTVTLSTTRTMGYIRRAEERPYELWMAALKGFEGPVYYIGTEGDFSFFRAGKLFYKRYKARTAKIRLPQTFDLGKGTPYQVTHEMVVRY